MCVRGAIGGLGGGVVRGKVHEVLVSPAAAKSAMLMTTCGRSERGAITDCRLEVGCEAPLVQCPNQFAMYAAMSVFTAASGP